MAMGVVSHGVKQGLQDTRLGVLSAITFTQCPVWTVGSMCGRIIPQGTPRLCYSTTVVGGITELTQAVATDGLDSQGS